jgi:hypothetical protein
LCGRNGPISGKEEVSGKYFRRQKCVYMNIEVMTAGEKHLRGKNPGIYEVGGVD